MSERSHPTHRHCSLAGPGLVPQSDEAPLWATRDTARFLGCTERQIPRLREEGLPTVRVGGLVRFVPSRVMEWLDRRDHGIPVEDRARQLADIAATGDDDNASCAAADLTREFPTPLS